MSESIICTTARRSNSNSRQSASLFDLLLTLSRYSVSCSKSRARASHRLQWVASPAIVGRGPTRLSAGPYQYTYERNGEVFATNQPNLGRDWYIIPLEPREEVC